MHQAGGQPFRIDQLLEEIQHLVHVYRLIATRSNDASIADELVELTDSLDSKLEQLRGIIA